MPKVKVSDIEMYYEEKGQGDPLLITTGWALGARWWSGPNAEVFADNYRCLVQDHRGMGASGAPDVSYTTKTMADDIAGLFDQLGISGVRIMGHGGMGGVIALQLAINHPDKIRSISVGAGCAKVDPFLRELMLVWGELRKLDPVLWAREVHLWSVTPAYYNAHPDSTQSAVANRIDNNPFLEPWSYDRTIEAYINHDVSDQLHLIKCPVMITSGGDGDPITGKRFAHELVNGIQGAQLHVFEDGGHNYRGVYHEEYTRLLLDFFANN